MQIKYKIIEAYPDDMTIVVRYYSESISESSLASQVDADGNMVRGRTDTAITLPIPTPVGQELEDLIMRACPVAFFEVKAAVLDPQIDTSLDHIAALIGVEVTVETAPPLQAEVSRIRATEHAVEVI